MPGDAVDHLEVTLVRLGVLDDQGLAVGEHPPGGAPLERNAQRPQHVALEPLHGQEAQFLGRFIVLEDGGQFAVGHLAGLGNDGL